MTAVWILLLAAVVAAAFAYVDREPRKPKLQPPQNVVEFTSRRKAR